MTASGAGRRSIERIEAPSPHGRGAMALLGGAAVALLFLAVTALAPAGASAAFADVPPLEDTNPDPDTFEAELVAEKADVDIGDGEGGEQLARGAFTYNGTIPGPEIRVKAGDRVIIHLRNELGPRHEVGATGVHWHGIELNNFSDGTAVAQNGVEEGEVFTYDFIAPRPGVFWYHPHHHPGNPVFKGHYAPLVVTDDADRQLQSEGVLPGPDDTHTLVLADTTVCKGEGNNPTFTFPAGLPWAGEGDMPVNDFQPTPLALCEHTGPGLWPDGEIHGPRGLHGETQDENGDPLPPHEPGEIPNPMGPAEGGTTNIEGETREGQLVLANGRVPGSREAHNPDGDGGQDLDPNNPDLLEVEAGQGVRLQMINTAVHRFFRLQATDHEGEQLDLARIGGEGGVLDHARLEGGTQGGWDTKYDNGELMLAPSERSDAVVSVPADAEEGDVLTVWTRDFRREPGFGILPTVPVLHMRVVGQAAETYTIEPGDPLRTHPEVADPIESLKDEQVEPLLDPLTFAEPLPGSDEEQISLTNVAGAGLSVDGVSAKLDDDVVDEETGEVLPFTDVPHPDSARYAQVDEQIELKIANETDQHHPFHPHGFSIQPLRMERAIRSEEGAITGWETIHNFGYQEFVDSFDIPAGHRLVYRAHLEDRPQVDGFERGGAVGRWVFHCHIFQHATQGMISEFVAVDSPFARAAPESVDLGEVRVGGAGATETVEIANQSDPQPEPLQIDDVTPSGQDSDDFTIVENGCDGQTLGKDESCPVRVRLEPTARGPREGALEVSSNDRESPLVVPLTGRGSASQLRLHLRVAHKQRGLKQIVGRARCREADCTAITRGRLRVRRANGKVRAFELPRRTRSLASGSFRRVSWKIPKRARRAAGKALRKGGKVRARVRLRAIGAEAQVTQVRLRQPKFR